MSTLENWKQYTLLSPQKPYPRDQNHKLKPVPFWGATLNAFFQLDALSGGNIVSRPKQNTCVKICVPQP